MYSCWLQDIASVMSEDLVKSFQSSLWFGVVITKLKLFDAQLMHMLLELTLHKLGPLSDLVNLGTFTNVKNDENTYCTMFLH